MYLRIDPNYPVVWRDSRTAQIGLDPVRSRIVVDDAAWAFGLSELVRGTSSERFVAVVGDPRRASALLDACGDVFVRLPFPTPPTVAVVGAGSGCDGVAHVWAGAASSVIRVRASADIVHKAIDVVVLVSDFVISPIETQPWLGSDVPHLAVIFSEESVSVGPVVIPGRGACIRCVELNRIERDPAWSAIAPQVWGRRAATSGFTLGTHAGADSLVMFRIQSAHSVRIDARTLIRTVTTHSPHPSCGCLAIPARTG